MGRIVIAIIALAVKNSEKTQSESSFTILLSTFVESFEDYLIYSTQR